MQNQTSEENMLCFWASLSFDRKVIRSHEEMVRTFSFILLQQEALQRVELRSGGRLSVSNITGVLSVCLSVCLSVFLSVCLSVCLYFCLSVISLSFCL